MIYTSGTDHVKAVAIIAPTKMVALVGGDSGRPHEGKMFPRGSTKKG